MDFNPSGGRWIKLWVTSPDSQSERRLGTDLTISQLKLKLEPITGIPAHSQILRLERTSSSAPGHSGQSSVAPDQSQVVGYLNDESRTLGSYGPTDYMTIRVDTTDPTIKAKAGQFTDVSLVDKFELTEEEYDKRTDTVRSFKLRNQLGRFAPSASETSSQFSDAAVPDDLKPGARCEVALSDELSRRGTVRFVGPTEFGQADGSAWVGVEWDEPVGKNDGLVAGKRYFQTLPLRASFVRPDKVTVGDFPEEDPFAEEDDLEEM